MFLIRLLAADRTNTVHVSIVSCLVSVSHSTCRKLQIQFCASAVRLRRDWQPDTVILSHLGDVFYFILSCEIAEKACSFKDANCGLLLELNHQLQKLPLVKWIKVIVEAICRLVNHPNPTVKAKKEFSVQTVLEVYWKQVPAFFLVFDTEMLQCVYPRLLPQFPFVWKHYWNKIASFEVFSRFKGEAWSVIFFFHSGLLCVYCHRKVHSGCRNCTISVSLSHTECFKHKKIEIECIKARQTCKNVPLFVIKQM